MAKPKPPNQPYNYVPGTGGAGGTKKPPKQKPGVAPPALPPVAGYTGPKKKGDQRATYIAWAKKIGISGKVAGDIWYAANRYNSGLGQGFAYYWTAVIQLESGGHHMNKYGQLTDSGQAVGIGQIAKSWIGQHIPWEPQGVVWTNNADPHTGIANYGLNLRFSAYLLSDAVNLYGYDGAYLKGYNPNDPNKQKAWAAIQKNLKTLPTGVGPLSPSGGGGSANNPGGSPTGTSSDPWVIGVDSKGNVKLSNTTDPPKNTIQWDGAPMTRTQFLSLRRQLDNYYTTFTGGRASNKQILQYIQKGWSTFSLEVALSKAPGFKKSPIYKARQPYYTDAARDLLAPGEVLPDALIRTAILNKWDGGTLQAVLRSQKGYVASNEFKNNSASLMNVHSSIMGIPDAQAVNLLKDATLAGWTPDQYAAWLRSRPEYTSSPEYQTKTINFLQTLGLITGENAVLKKGSPTETNPNLSTGPAPPTDKRVPGPAGLTRPEDTVPTYGG